MDLYLLIIKTKANLYSIQTRIRLERERIQKEKPNAKPYIDGAIQSEKELLEAYQAFTDLSDHILAISRENTELARRNIKLQEKILELENQIKYNKIENQI